MADINSRLERLEEQQKLNATKHDELGMNFRRNLTN